MTSLPELPPHPIHVKSEENPNPIAQYDVFIAGSGPIGATFARLLVDAGHNVVMTEIGDQDTLVPGAHKKNQIEYQKDIDRFVRVIQGALSTVSIPVSTAFEPTADPSSWRPPPKYPILTQGRNSMQREYNNLGAEAVTRGVGGMSTHWTCSTPEFLKGLERPVIFENSDNEEEEWKLLYDSARALIGTSEHEFDESIRHTLVLETLRDAFSGPSDTRVVKPLPLACHRLDNGSSPYVQWHAADSPFGDMFTKRDKTNRYGVKRGRFILLTNTRCTRLHFPRDGSAPHKIEFVEVKDLLRDRLGEKRQTNFAILAKSFIVAAGAIGTPQILANSGLGGIRGQENPLVPNLGIRITEQPMAFCQVVMRQGLVDSVKNLDNRPDWWRNAVRDHMENNPNDPCPIPFQDGEPQVTIPATPERPWHTQIHRDAFSYGEAGPLVDPRVVVDLRFFGMQEGVRENRLIFENNLKDAYGMPQPTFEYTPTSERALESSNMMNDMTNVAHKLGGYLPGSNPQFMTPGLALHLGGSTRLGQTEDETTGNFNSQIWKFKNLYVGGNGLIPTPFAANPTLTSMCFAIRAAYKLHRDLESDSFTEPVSGATLEPTPRDWVNWAYDKTDPNWPDHRNLRRLHCQV